MPERWSYHRALYGDHLTSTGTDFPRPIPGLVDDILTSEVPDFQPADAAPGKGTKLYIADPFVSENFTGNPDAVVGASETVSPCDMNTGKPRLQ